MKIEEELLSSQPQHQVLKTRPEIHEAFPSSYEYIIAIKRGKQKEHNFIHKDN